MKRMLYFVMAFAMVLGFIQCKKEQPLEPQGEQVRITLDVSGNGNNGSKVNVDPPHVTFEKDDVILVGYDGKYVGYLTHDGTNFTGSINSSGDGGKKLYFFFAGNKVDVTSLSAGTDTECTVDISNQSAELPVLSFSESNENFNGEGSYTASLHNQCALVEFTTNAIPVWTNVSVSGMKNKATISFSANSITPTGETGSIKLYAKRNTSRWAILLKQDAVTTTATADGYNESGSFTVPAVENNGYCPNPQGASFTMTEDGTFDAYSTPLTFEATKANSSVKFTAGTSVLPSQPTLQYSLNGDAWNSYTSNTTIYLTNIGDKVSFRGNNTTVSSGSSTNQYSKFTLTNGCYVYGNVMSLVNFETEMKADYEFYRLFYNNSILYSHPSKAMVLPATTLTPNCYREMFYVCYNLTTAPALPATTLADHCYSYMFQGCTNLTTAPELPATELANYCYAFMFQGCTNLATAPELPATELADHCYECMFSRCNLATAPALPATTLALNCYESMFLECRNLTTAPALPATTLANYCYASMFSGCDKLTTAPELPATTLVKGCYYYMFNGCTDLNSVTCLATTIPDYSYCTQYWLKDVASSGTFTKAASMTGWPTGSPNGIPEDWTVNNYSAK